MFMDNKKSLKLEILEQIASLVTAGFGLVAALAWNEVIKEFFATFFPAPNLLLGKFIYAVIITILVVVITVKLGNLIGKLKEKIDEQENE
jgi:uncharacterized membrane protein